MNRATTAFLLTCAAIGVAGGILLWGDSLLSTALFATVPFASIATTGIWMLPATVALRLLERPLAGILVGVLSGLVAFPFLGAAIWFAVFAEIAFLVTLYRSWRTWQYYAGAVFTGVVYAAATGAAIGVWSMSAGAVAAFFALSIASCVVGVALAIFIADRLKHAGVARLARRRGLAARGLGRGDGPAGQH
jgi:energy-coupling factor transport system substrate-specific component